MGEIILLTYDLIMGSFLACTSLLFYRTQVCGFFFFLSLVLGWGGGGGGGGTASRKRRG